MGKNWAHSVDQCWLQVLQFLVHLIDLLSVLLCSGLAGIQKAIVDQQDNRPQDSDHDLLVQIWLSECFGASLSAATEMALTGCHIKSAFVTHRNPIEK